MDIQSSYSKDKAKEAGTGPYAAEVENRSLSDVSLSDVSTQIQADAALQRVNNERIAIIRCSPVAIVTQTLDGVVTGWNPAAEAMFGYTETEAIGNSYPLAPPAQRSDSPTLSERMLDTETFQNVETVRLHKNGTLVAVSVSGALLRDSEANIHGIVHIYSDITARKQTEERLRGSEENYRVLAESMDDVVSLHDSTGRILYISPSVYRATGYMPEELIGLEGLAFAHPEDRERVYQKTQALHRQGLSTQVEWRRMSKDGQYRWCETRANPLLDEQGRPDRLLCTTRDITERRLAESALRKTNKRLANILESLQEAFIAIDRQWRFSFLNARAEAMLNRTRSELIGKSLWEEFPEWVTSRSYQAYHRAMTKQVSVTIEEVIPESGVWLQIQAYPSQDGLSIYAQDITDRRNVEQELRTSLSKLQRSVTSIAEAMALAVEFRDPYTAGHQRRVSILAAAIAREMGFPGKQIEEIRMAGLLHDVGKLAIPSEIMCKPGRISGPEMSIIRTHPQVGYEMLKGIEFDAPVALVALQHHERLDGSGYPAGLLGEEILVESRIMAVADVVEAMASHRPYRPGLGIEVALAEVVDGQGTRYDGTAVDACLRALGFFSFDLELLLKRDGQPEQDSE